MPFCFGAIIAFSNTYTFGQIFIWENDANSIEF